MPPESASDVTAQPEVMASVDDDSDEFVIADISREDAWLTVRADDAPVLTEWA